MGVDPFGDLGGCVSNDPGRIVREAEIRSPRDEGMSRIVRHDLRPVRQLGILHGRIPTALAPVTRAWRLAGVGREEDVRVPLAPLELVEEEQTVLGSGSSTILASDLGARAVPWP
jgi:hypothetical protein